MRLTHVRLLVRDYERSLRFWRDTVGFPVTLDTGPARYAELDAGQATLAIFDAGYMARALGAEPDDGPRGGDQAVLFMAVGDVDQAARDLEGRGVTFVSAPTDQPAWELRVAHFRDPEANLVEIYHPLPRPAAAS